MTDNDSKPSETGHSPTKASKRTVAEKLAVAERLRDLQKTLAPIREANRKRVAEQQSRNKTK